MPGLTAPPRPSGADRFALALLAGLTLWACMVFDHYGPSNDEEVQHVYGRLLLAFYASGLTDQAAFVYKNLYLYGGLFDLLAALLERWSTTNLWDVRHLLSALFGLAGLTATWLATRRLAGSAAALLALLLLALTGAWSGAMFTHTKDIPFAAAMAWTLYFSLRLLPELPHPRLGTALGLGAALGCAFGLRVGAVFALAWLGAGLLATAWISRPAAGQRLRFLAGSVLALWPAWLTALLLTALFWPWAFLSVENVWRAMTAFSHFSFDLHTVLAGQTLLNGEAPGHYLLSYLVVRLPEAFLLGLLLAAFGVHARLQADSEAQMPVLTPLWLTTGIAALLPLAYTLLAAPALYNGLRHFTFVLPPLAILAGTGLAWALARCRGTARIGRLFALSLGLLLLIHAQQLFRLHPYEYLSYNQLTGGLAGAQGRWEMDYWAASLREATLRLSARLAQEAPQRAYRVAACAEPFQVEDWLPPGIRLTEDWLEADFFLSPTQMGCDKALDGPVLLTVERNGTVLAVVRDRRPQPPSLP